MQYPEFLQKNGTIGFVAPSFGCATEPYKSLFQNALSKFEEMGYKKNLGPNCTAEKGIGISNTPKACGQELNDYYCSDENDVIISCGGGELMCEVVPYMDFERMKQAKPKWYMGYSDNTNFTFLSATIMDRAAIYGPCVSDFGMEPWHPSIQDAFSLLCGELEEVHNYDLWEREKFDVSINPLLPYNVTEPTVMHAYHPKEVTCVNMSGRLLGGCMDCLVNLLGTEFDQVDCFNEKYAKEGIIWFLESCDLNVMSIRRAIWQMKHAGWFQGVKGFLIGRPLCYGQEMFGIDHHQAVIDILKEFDVPILMDLDIGHLSPMMPIVTGATCEVNFENNTFRMNYIWK